MGHISVHGAKFQNGKATDEMLEFHQSHYLPFVVGAQRALADMDFEYACEVFEEYRSEMYRRNFKSSQSNFAPSVVQEFVGMMVNAVFHDPMIDQQKIRNFDFQAEVKLKTKNTTFTFADGSTEVSSNKNQDVAVFSKIDRSPIIVIECKTYVDATMLSSFRDVCRTLQDNFPLCTNLVVMETCALDGKYHKFSDPAIDGVFVLSSQFKREQTNEGVAGLTFKPDVLERVYTSIRDTINKFPLNGEISSQQFREDGYWFKSKFG
jgi:hypothetical protein